MKLLTPEIIKKLPKLYETENIPVEKKKAVIKFFTPDSNWTWYVVEGEREGNDWLFFGLVEGHFTEWGYFSLSELQSERGPLGLPIERDLYFDGEIPERLRR
jgi:hypothetical protein